MFRCSHTSHIKPLHAQVDEALDDEVASVPASDAEGPPTSDASGDASAAEETPVERRKRKRAFALAELAKEAEVSLRGGATHPSLPKASAAGRLLQPKRTFDI